MTHKQRSPMTFALPESSSAVVKLGSCPNTLTKKAFRMKILQLLEQRRSLEFETNHVSFEIIPKGEKRVLYAVNNNIVGFPRTVRVQYAKSLLYDFFEVPFGIWRVGAEDYLCMNQHLIFE